MATGGGGKAKSRRYLDHGKPYERRKSLIGRVTDTVKGLFAPTWLVGEGDAVASTSSHTLSQAELQRPDSNRDDHDNARSNQLRLVNDSNATNTPSQSQTIASSSVSMSSAEPISVKSSSVVAYPAMAGGSAEAPNFTSEHLPIINSRTAKSSSLIVNGADDRSELSDYSVSTSGCSSLIPHPDRVDYMQDLLNEKRMRQIREEYGGSVTPSKESVNTGGKGLPSVSHTLTGEKSFLWSGETSSRLGTPQRSAVSKHPSFNVSLFGSSLQTSRQNASLSSSFQTQLYHSPAVFGGAASQKKRKLSETSPGEVVLPNKRQVQARSLSSSSSGVSSSTAKRILDSLEKMSSPLRDAKKIPSYNSSLVDSPLSFSQPSYGSTLTRRRSLPAKHLTGRGSSEGPPVHALQTPTRVQISRNINRITPGPSLPRVPEDRSTQPSASDIETERQKSGAMDSVGRQGKMRREKSSQHYSCRREEEEVAEIPDLPVNFTLPATTLPTFEFGSATGGKSQGSPPNSKQAFSFSQPINRSITPKPASQSPAQTFQFSSPLQIGSQRHDSKPGFASGSMTTAGKNTAPQAAGSLSTGAPASTSSSLAFRYNPLAAAKRKDMDVEKEKPPLPVPSELKAGSVMDVLKGEAKASAVSPPAASALKTGSVMDILGKTAGTSSTGQPSLSAMFKKNSNAWECPTCMIENKPDSQKCVACETAKPGPAPSVSVPVVDTKAMSGGSLSDLFKKPSGSWDCPTCMIQNTSTHDKCPACETPNPGAAKTSTPTASSSQVCPPMTSSGPSLAAMFAKPSGAWDCDTCLVSNKGEASKCVACETPKPGMKRVSSFTSAGGFKVGPSGGFGSDGVDDPSKDSASEVGPKSAGFSLSAKPADDTASKKDPASQAIKLGASGGFTFGGSGGDTKLAPGGFSFGGDTKGLNGVTSTASSRSVDSGFSADFGSIPDKPVAGGFKFGQSLAGDSKNTDTASVGGGKKPPPSYGGFGAAAAAASSKRTATGKKTDTAVSKASVGGFQFGTTAPSEQVVKDTGANVSAASEHKFSGAGGFSFGASPAAPAPTSASPAPTPASAGGINFTAPAAAVETTPAANSVSGGSSSAAQTATGLFQFGNGGTKASEANGVKPAQGVGLGTTAFAPAAQASGAQASGALASGAQATGLFSFGAAKPGNQPAATNNNNSGMFAFGAGKAQQGSESTATGSSPFTFGAGAKAAAGAAMPQPNANSASPFAFGTAAGLNKPSATPPAAAVTTTTTATNMLFHFKPSDPSAPLTTSSGPPAGGLFSFGAKPTGPAAGGVGASAAPFAFGAKGAETGTAASTQAATPASGTFSFGAKQPSSAQQPAQQAASAAGMFAFGAKPSEQTSTQPQQQQQSGAGLFTFGASADKAGQALSSGRVGGSIGSGSISGAAAGATSSGGHASLLGSAAATTPLISSHFALGAKQLPAATAPAPSILGKRAGSEDSTGLFGEKKLNKEGGASTGGGAMSTFGQSGQTSGGSLAFGNGPTSTPGSQFGSFGAGSGATAPAFGSAASSGSSTMTFGGGAGSTPAFGTTTLATAATSPVFASAAAQQTTPSTGFNFGGGPVTQATGPFQFGQGAATGNPSGFSFSGGQSQAASGGQTAAAPGAPSATPATATPAAAPFNAAPNFNFGSPQPANFQFNAAATPPANPFSVATPAGASGQRRPIKKAVRKLRK